MIWKLTFTILVIFLVSCSPRTYELANGKMVTSHRFECVNRRCDRRLTDSAHKERLIRRLFKNSARNSGKKLSSEMQELFSGIVSFEVVYDTGRND